MGSLKKHVPNAITLARLAGSPFIPYGLMALWNPRAIVLLALSLACTDLIDGFLARHLKAISKFGARLDPIADAVFCASLFVAVLVLYLPNPIIAAVWTLFAVYFSWYAWAVTRLRVRGKIENPSACARVSMALLFTSLAFAFISGVVPYLVPLSRFLAWNHWIKENFWLLHLFPVLGMIAALLTSSKSLADYEGRPWIASLPRGR